MAYGLAVYRTPEGQQGGYAAVFALGFTVATIVGPAVMGSLLDRGRQGWAALAGWFPLLSAVSRARSVTGGAQRE